MQCRRGADGREAERAQPGATPTSHTRILRPSARQTCTARFRLSTAQGCPPPPAEAGGVPTKSWADMSCSLSDLASEGSWEAPTAALPNFATETPEQASEEVTAARALVHCRGRPLSTGRCCGFACGPSRKDRPLGWRADRQPPAVDGQFFGSLSADGGCGGSFVFSVPMTHSHDISLRAVRCCFLRGNARFLGEPCINDTFFSFLQKGCPGQGDLGRTILSCVGHQLYRCATVLGRSKVLLLLLLHGENLSVGCGRTSTYTRKHQPAHSLSLDGQAPPQIKGGLSAQFY